jgi:ribosomal protein S14
MSQPGPAAPKGTRLRGKCPECGRTRALRTKSPTTGIPLPGAVMATHRDQRVVAYRECVGTGRPPVTVVSD